MNNLTNKLSEYCFGTETHRDYVNNRSFYREHVTNKNSLKILFKKSYLDEAFYLIYSRMLPNILTLGGVGMFLYDRNYRWLGFSAFGEILRLSEMIIHEVKDRREESERKSLIKEVNNLNDMES